MTGGADPDTTPGDPLSSAGVDRAALGQAVGELPESLKLAVSLHLYEGLSVSEISEVLGIEQEQAERLVTEALERLAPGGRAASEQADREVVEPTYLPFSEEQLLGHFIRSSSQGADQNPERHLAYYRASAARYREFMEGDPQRKALPLSKLRRPCQIEKDERFWVVCCLMGYAHGPDPAALWAELLASAFCETPPLEGVRSWEECLSGELELFFEVNLPSPPSYREWLRQNIATRNVVPYVIDAAAGAGTRLEGATHVDALLLNRSTGFSVLFEAKALSDASYHVSFDSMRNQIARNVDVMLERNEKLGEPLSLRNPDRTLFALLTPGLYRQHPRSRLYGCLMDDYARHPEDLGRDLPHRRGVDWPGLSRRLGWLTWEDCESTLPGSCPWLAQAGAEAPAS
jgi:hypothetical protein